MCLLTEFRSSGPPSTSQDSLVFLLTLIGLLLPLPHPIPLFPRNLFFLLLRVVLLSVVVVIVLLLLLLLGFSLRRWHGSWRVRVVLPHAVAAKDNEQDHQSHGASDGHHQVIAQPGKDTV